MNLAIRKVKGMSIREVSQLVNIVAGMARISTYSNGRITPSLSLAYPRATRIRVNLGITTSASGFAGSC